MSYAFFEIHDCLIANIENGTIKLNYRTTVTSFAAGKPLLVFTYFAVFSSGVNCTHTAVFLVCKSIQASSIVKTRITGACVLMETKYTQIIGN